MHTSIKHASHQSMTVNLLTHFPPECTHVYTLSTRDREVPPRHALWYISVSCREALSKPLYNARLDKCANKQTQGRPDTTTISTFTSKFSERFFFSVLPLSIHISSRNIREVGALSKRLLQLMSFPPVHPFAFPPPPSPGFPSANGTRRTSPDDDTHPGCH